MASKKSICVLFGGVSSEHEVSCVSASNVIENLDKELYTVYSMGITKEGKWYLYTGKTENIKSNKWNLDKQNLKPAIFSPDREDKGIILKDSNVLIKIDVAFPVIHGFYGEDGSMQGLFELSGVKYVGMGILASSVGLDKHYTKVVCSHYGISQGKWECVLKEKWGVRDATIATIENNIGYPVFVKPANAGSSIGISKAKDKGELIAAIETAFIYDRKVIVEEFIKGKELECAVIGDYNEKFASCVGEIKPKREFYDYEAKYVEDTTELVIPADISDEKSNQIRATAIKVFEALDGKGLSRVDFFLTDDGRVVFNEINTIPGFTSISMYPKLMEQSGLSYSKLLTRLVEIAEQ